jgi:hypothetical protein
VPNGPANKAARDAIIRRNGWAVAWLATMVGVAIMGSHLESGKDRWTAANWHFAMQIPGSPATWGVVIFVAGLAMLWGNMHHSWRVFRAGGWIACAWFCAVDGAAILAFFGDLLDDDPINSTNPLLVIFVTYIAYMYRERVQLADRRHA